MIRPQTLREAADTLNLTPEIQETRRAAVRALREAADALEQLYAAVHDIATSLITLSEGVSSEPTA